MRTETDNSLDSYQQQIAATQEICEAFIEGTGRIETVWFEQARKAIEEQLKFFQASAAVRDPQGLAALHSAFFSHSPEAIIKAQQQVLDVAIETQNKISDALHKHISGMKTGPKPWLNGKNASGEGSAGSLYLAWHKAFQDAMELASLGVKALPLPESDATRISGGDKEAHSKQR